MKNKENGEWTLLCFCVSVGTVLGLLFGLIFENLSVGLSAGAAIGLLIGYAGYAVNKVRNG